MVPAGAREGESCMSRSECSGELACIDFKCSSASTQQQAREQRTRLGVAFGVYSGLGGTLANGSSGLSVGPEFSIGLGPIRWHALFAFDNLNSFNGGRLELLTFGIPLTVMNLNAKSRLEVEPIVSLFQTEWLGGSSGFQAFGSSMLAAQVNLGLDRLFVSVMPVGFELREYTWQGDSLTQDVSGATGFNYVFRASSGVQF
jgi:hypothetical protein